MMTQPVARRLVVNADDFGRSASVNEAVRLACEQGILTNASLMVNEPAAGDAARWAAGHPRLGIGLHLTLCQGFSALPPEEIPGLVDADGRFGNHPVALGCRYFFRPALRDQLYREISAQFRKLKALGLPCGHVDGHLHLHMQPAVFRLLAENAGKWGVARFRLVCEPLRPNLRAARGRWLRRFIHAAIFRGLAAFQRRRLRRLGIRFPRAVFGQLQDGRVTEDYLLRLLPQLRPGDSELYTHPSMDEPRHEFEALVSPRVRDLAAHLGLRLIRYDQI